MAIITKKILPEWFDAIASGQKKYELRLADFDIQEGDTLRLEEWVGEGEGRKATGRVIEKKISYVRNFDVDTWMKQQPEIKEKGMYVLQFDDSKNEAEKKYVQEETYGLLLIGIAFGIIGGMAANVLDRIFGQFGVWYDLIIVILFAVACAGLTYLLKRKLKYMK